MCCDMMESVENLSLAIERKQSGKRKLRVLGVNNKKPVCFLICSQKA